MKELKKKGKKVGTLRYKTSLNSFKALNFNQSGFRIDFERKGLVLSKVGEIPIKLHRPIEGKIKGVLVKRENQAQVSQTPRETQESAGRFPSQAQLIYILPI